MVFGLSSAVTLVLVRYYWCRGRDRFCCGYRCRCWDILLHFLLIFVSWKKNRTTVDGIWTRVPNIRNLRRESLRCRRSTVVGVVRWYLLSSGVTDLSNLLESGADRKSCWLDPSIKYPKCSDSRTSLLTTSYPHQSPVWDCSLVEGLDVRYEPYRCNSTRYQISGIKKI